MRVILRQMAWRQLKALRWRSLARTGSTAVRLWTGRTPPAPLFLTVALTYRCNYRCGMCSLPQRSEKIPPSRNRIHALLTRFASAGTVAVGFTGGEPTHRTDLEAIIHDAVELGLIVHLNTNGSRLTWRRARSLLASGLQSINISLDGAQAATHDRLRGRPGSFAEIVEATARLLQVRRDQGARTRVRLVMALSPTNHTEIGDLLRLGSRLKVDGIGFLPMHELSTSETAPIDPRTADDLADSLARLRRGEYRRLLDNSDAYLRAIPGFLAGSETPTRCSAPRTHLAVDPFLNTYPCVPLMTLGHQSMGHVDESWQPRAAELTVQPSLCRHCWWNCHRELDIAFHRI